MKRLFALLFAGIVTLSFVGCGDAEQSPTDATDSAVQSELSSSAVSSDSDSSTDSSDTSTETWKPSTEYPDQVLACDQNGGRIVVYDMSLVGQDGNLDKAEIWEYPTGSLASIKYREGTVFGDVVLFVSNQGGPTVLTYPGKEVVWEGGIGSAGINPHSIEILPSGNVVTASTTDGLLRIFNTKNVVKNGASLVFSSYSLPGVHGVLWDPTYQFLWALGDYDLVAYQVVDGGDGTQTLKKINGLGGKLPTNWGHDLSADFSDPRYLWCTTGKGVYRFDKEDGTFSSSYSQNGKLNKSNVKGFGNNMNGNFFYCFPNKGVGRSWQNENFAEWCTDTLYFCYWKRANFLTAQAYTSHTSAFYKARVFYGQYQ